MPKAAYKTKQQDLLLSYLRQMQGKHFTAEDVRSHFAKKDITIGIATIYRQLEKLVAEGTIQKYFIVEHSASNTLVKTAIQKNLTFILNVKYAAA